MPFLSWFRNSDGYSNVGPQEKAETEALNSCGLNFLLLQILQNLKVLWIHCYIAPPTVLEEPCASGCFSSLSFIIVITDPPWLELEVHELFDLLVIGEFSFLPFFLLSRIIFSIIFYSFDYPTFIYCNSIYTGVQYVMGQADK